MGFLQKAKVYREQIKKGSPPPSIKQRIEKEEKEWEKEIVESELNRYEDQKVRS